MDKLTFRTCREFGVMVLNIYFEDALTNNPNGSYQEVLTKIAVDPNLQQNENLVPNQGL